MDNQSNERPDITRKIALGWKVVNSRVNEKYRWEIENFVGSFVEWEGRRKNEENKFLFVKVTIVNSGLLMNGKYFKYLL